MSEQVTEDRVRAVLSEAYTAEGVEVWLDRYVRDGRTAREWIASGEGDVILTRARFIAGRAR